MTGRWFSSGIPVSSTNKIDCHDIAEILLKVALNTIILILNIFCEKPQESEVLSIIRYRGTSKIAGKLCFFYTFPAIFEVPLYLIIDRTSDSCGETYYSSYKSQTFLHECQYHLVRSKKNFITC